VNATHPLAPELLEFHAPKLAPLIERYEREQALHTTLLFTGIEGTGKRSLVLHFIRLLFCDRSVFAKKTDEEDSLFGGGHFGDALAPAEPTTGRTPCGECPSCIRADRGQWLDLIWLDPEEDEDGKRLSVHRIKPFRELREKLGLGPAEEPFRVAVITEAERMNTESANSILKMLEEPPKNWLFILTASDSSRLLPTILSRCMEIKLAPLEPARIFSVLKGSLGTEFNSTRARVASRAAMGSLSRAKSYLDDETWELRDGLLGLLSHPAAEWMKLIDSLSGSQVRMGLALDLIESLLTDLLKHQVVGPAHEWIHEDQREVLIQISEKSKLRPPQLIERLALISEKRKLVALTLNAKLLAGEILAPLLERP
jgi:DNA polymerase-3 subunit delta'